MLSLGMKLVAFGLAFSAAPTFAQAPRAVKVQQSNVVVNGSAKAEGSRLILTEAIPDQAGSVWFSAPVEVASGFDTSFQFQITERHLGGDGFAFVIQNQSPDSLGHYGGSLGYGGIANAVAIEFDTWRNAHPFAFESNDNHVAILTNGVRSLWSSHAFELASQPSPGVRIGDGNVHTVRVVAKGHVMSVYLDGARILHRPIVLSETLDLSHGKAWIGFTAGTGDSFQKQVVFNWSIAVSGH